MRIGKEWISGWGGSACEQAFTGRVIQLAGGERVRAGKKVEREDHSAEAEGGIAAGGERAFGTEDAFVAQRD